jgi:hypothetical protein
MHVGQARRGVTPWLHMPADIRDYFRVLELSPGATLEEIKRSYRLLLQRWHPDRYKPGSVMQTTAEDVTKELNEAYHQLCRKKRYLEFRPKPRASAAAGPTREPWPAARRHGWKAYQQAAEAAESHSHRSPPAPAEAPPSPTGPAGHAERPAPPPARRASPSKTARAEGTGRRMHWPWRWLIGPAFVVGLLAVLAVWREWLEEAPVHVVPPRRVVRLPAAPESIVVAAPQRATTTAPAAPAPSLPSPLEFTAPVFAESAVFSLDPRRALSAREDEPEAVAESRWLVGPLVVRSLATSLTPSFSPLRFDDRNVTGDAWSLLDTFAPGDSKARVIAVQGAPDEVGENVFRYGSSIIFFEAGRVTHWNEGRPALRVLVLPRFAFPGLMRFGVGSTREEVIRAQGEPTASTATAFYYGASAVYFDREWVTGWSDIDQRLHTRIRAAGIGLP